MAHCAAGDGLGARLLEPSGQRLSVDQRLLGHSECGNRRDPGDRVSAPAAGNPGNRGQQPAADRRTISGSPVIGSGMAAATHGGPAIGAALKRIGCGFPLATCGRPADTSSSHGHWDYCMAQRGLAFCPVAFTTPVYTQAGYYYTPSVCIQTSVLNDYLFCRPAYCHYYFGDYYGPQYASIGIYPWFAVGVRIGYEPCFVHDRWYYGRHDPHWEANLRVNYNYRVAHVEARPPRTWEASLRVGPGAQVAVMGAPLNHYAAVGSCPLPHGNRLRRAARRVPKVWRPGAWRSGRTPRHGDKGPGRTSQWSGQSVVSDEDAVGLDLSGERFHRPRRDFRGGNEYGHPGSAAVRPGTQPGRVDTTRTYHPGTTTTPSHDTRTVPAKDRSQRDKDKDYGGR